MRRLIAVMWQIARSVGETTRHNVTFLAFVMYLVVSGIAFVMVAEIIGHSLNDGAAQGSLSQLFDSEVSGAGEVSKPDSGGAAAADTEEGGSLASGLSRILGNFVSGSEDTVDNNDTKALDERRSTVWDFQSWLILAVIVLSIATIVAVVTCFRLYYWRYGLLAHRGSLAPEHWTEYLERVRRDLNQLKGTVDQATQGLFQRSEHSSEQISNMVKTYMALQKGLDDRDAEIRRLKEGWDTQVFERFLIRFTRVHRALCEFAAEEKDDSQEFRQLRVLMEDALEESGVEQFEPEIGADYRTEEGVADNPKIVKVTTPEKSYRIAEIVDPGYRLVSGENVKVIVRAKVRIFQFED